MRLCFTGLAGLTLVSFLTSARAEPIMGTVTVTVAPASASGSQPGPGIPSAATFSSGTVDLSTLPSSLFLSGPTLGLNTTGGDGPINDTVVTTFQMTITFDGASGNQPSIDITGSVLGYDQQGQPPSGFPPTAENTNPASSSYYATPTSATLLGWRSNSGISMTLINQYLDLSAYHLTQYLFQASGTSLPPATSDFVLAISPSDGGVSPSGPSSPPGNSGSTQGGSPPPIGVQAPEPASVLIYAATIVALAARRSDRLRRLFSAR
jgi:hypothetical protein